MNHMLDNVGYVNQRGYRAMLRRARMLCVHA